MSPGLQEQTGKAFVGREELAREARTQPCPRLHTSPWRLVLGKG